MTAITLRRTDRSNFGSFFALVVCSAEIAGVWRSLNPLLDVWSQEEYSHAWFILPLSALIFIQRFRTVHLDGSSTLGVPVALISVFVMFFAWATGSYTASIYGAILELIGFIWSAVGTEAMRTLAAPLIYLFFMVPLPVAIYISTSAEMQLLSSKLGMLLISLFHVPATFDGNIIILASARLEVAEACSGLRYLFPLVSFAVLISMLIADRLWKKAIIVISSVPIAIVLNAGRIAMIAVLIERFGIDTSAGPAHAFEGFAVFFFCVVLLFLEVWCLLKIGEPRGRFVLSELLVLDRNGLSRLIAWPVSRASLIAGIILLAGSGVVATLPARMEIIPHRQPFALFPMDFDGWHGTPQPLDSESLNALGLTDYLLADYTLEATDSGPVNFYIAYYASQRAGLHAHSPQLCIPGGGWSIINQSIVSMPLTYAGLIRANRVVIEKRGVRQLVYYWFEERGRHIAKEGTLKYYGLRDALVDNRSDGALVRVVTRIRDQDEAAADKTVREFAEEAGVFIAHFVPGQTH